MTDDYDITRNYHRGNSESMRARELSRYRAGVDRRRIIELVRVRGGSGITCDEAEVALRLPHQTCSARFSELKADGVLLPTEMTRQTRRNAPARVMVLSPLQVKPANQIDWP